MIRVLPEIIEAETWTVAFHRTASRRWIGWLAVGRYKHVSAFAWLPALRLWVVYEVGLAGTRIVHLPDGPAALRRLAEFTADADLMQVRVNRICINRGLFADFANNLGFYCVSAIKHLIGLRSGALRPDTLWRDCLRNGGIPIGSPANPRPGVRPELPANAGSGQ